MAIAGSYNYHLWCTTIDNNIKTAVTVLAIDAPTGIILARHLSCAYTQIRLQCIHRYQQQKLINNVHLALLICISCLALSPALCAQNYVAMDTVQIMRMRSLTGDTKPIPNLKPRPFTWPDSRAGKGRVTGDIGTVSWLYRRVISCQYYAINNVPVPRCYAMQCTIKELRSHWLALNRQLTLHDRCCATRCKVTWKSWSYNLIGFRKRMLSLQESNVTRPFLGVGSVNSYTSGGGEGYTPNCPSVSYDGVSVCEQEAGLWVSRA